MLTQALVGAGARLLVLERDAALVAQLRARFGGLAGVDIVRSDAAVHGWPDEPFVIVANLPFARSGTILARLLRDPQVPLRRAHVIVQWDFATKHAAVWPATLRATYWRAWFEVSIARRLDRSAFVPRPSVDAAVLRLERRTRPRVPVESHEAYWRFLSAAFAAREPLRRSLRPALSALEIKRLAPALGFAPDARPWDLDAEQWVELFAFSRRSQLPGASGSIGKQRH